MRIPARLTVLLLTVPLPAPAIQACELNGEHVNPANGHSTAGQTGLMRCKDADSGQIQREQELKDGTFMGLVRFYGNGVLEQQYSTNERGNRDGMARTFAATPGAKNPLLREETMRNGTPVGLARSWHASGALRRASQRLRRDTGFHDNGKPAFEVSWLLEGRYERQAQGVHRRFDGAGRLRSERHHDDRGRVTRDRELDEAGQVTRDDAVYEDGSRKAFSR